MNIKYKIEMHTDWHCGSGLAAGADLDALVVKDKDELPFVPGKTIKGLLHEAVEEILSLQGETETATFHEAFGYFQDTEHLDKGKMFFTNAELSEKERKAIISNNAARFLYRSISSTAIEPNGIAKDHSLRKTQVTIPCTLHGEIQDIPDELEAVMLQALKFVKRLGQNRNRGLGRCTITKE